jgi:hypothetical protein
MHLARDVKKEQQNVMENARGTKSSRKRWRRSKKTERMIA